MAATRFVILTTLSILTVLLGAALPVQASGGACFLGLGDESTGVGIGSDVEWADEGMPKFWCATERSCGGIFVEIHEAGLDGGHCNEFGA